MKTIKEVTLNNGLAIVLESVSTKGGVIGYMISKYENGLRRYLSSPLNLTEADEHMEFFKNAYSK